MITIEGFLLGAFVVTCVYHFFLFLFYKKNYPALYFSLITLSASMLTIVKETEWLYKNKMIVLIFIIVPLMYLEFTRHMYPEEFKNKVCRFLDKGLYVYVFFYSVLILFLPNSIFINSVALFSKITVFMDVFTIIYMISQLIRASFRKKSDSRLMLIGFLILFLSAILIYMIPSNIFIRNNAVGALGILTIYSITLARRYSGAYHSCERLVEERTMELRDNNKKLLFLINHDTLTKAFSRKYILDNLNFQFEKSMTKGFSFSIIMYDLDFFKKINDTYGHGVGDDVLIKVVNKSFEFLKGAGDIGRIGGEEFLIILPDCKLKEAVGKANDLREELKNIKFSDGKEVFYISCSMGVVEFDKNFDNFDEMLIRVDKALYRAKETGRDKVCY